MLRLTSNLFVKRKEINQRAIGLGLMAVSGFFRTLSNTLVQYISHIYKDVSLYELLFMRSFIQLLFCVFFLVYKKTHLYGDKKLNLLFLFLMGVAEVAAVILFYYSLQMIPVADATVAHFTAPLFTVFFSFLFLRKGCGIVEIICGIISLFGVVVIAKPDLIMLDNWHIAIIKHSNNTTLAYETPQYMLGSSFALLASVALSLYFVLNKINGSQLDISLTVFYPSFIGVIVSPIAIILKHDQLTMLTQIKAYHWYTIVVMGVVSFIGLMLMSKSLQLEDAGPAVLIRNCDILYAFLLQYIIMNIPPSRHTLLGSIIVLGASSLLIIHRTFSLQMHCCSKWCCQKCKNKEQTQTEEEIKFISSEPVEEDE